MDIEKKIKEAFSKSLNYFEGMSITQITNAWEFGYPWFRKGYNRGYINGSRDTIEEFKNQLSPK